MQEFMSYLWKNRLLSSKRLRTTNGEPIEIFDVGNEERNGTFNSAKLKIGDTIWSGNVVIHNNSSDWEKEIVGKKSLYENVILHITLNDDIDTIRKNGESIHQLRISCNENTLESYTEMLNGKFEPLCKQVAAQCSEINLHNYLSRLLIERIEEKAEKITMLHKNCQNHWNDTLFKLLARSFGFGIQSHIFEEWALLLDLQAASKHRDNIEQVEAIFFGQAGLLNESSIPAYYREEALKNEYFRTLQREYKFLKTKFGLKEMKAESWGYGNFTPHIRISRLAAHFCSGKAGIAQISNCYTIPELRDILQIQPSWYWQHHTQFGGTATIGCGDISRKHLDVLIINAIIPTLYSYGKHRKDIELCNKGEDFLHELDSEDNSIIRRWAQKGINATCAADSQALIQLNNAYCAKHKCCECRFASIFFKDKIATC